MTTAQVPQLYTEPKVPFIPEFHGQQADERILYVIPAHQLKFWLGVLESVLFSGILYQIISFIAFSKAFSSLPAGYGPQEIRIGGILVSLILMVALLWWNSVSFEKAKTVLTDRRIIRFEALFPFWVAKRSYFWDDIAKVKGYAPNIIFRLLNIGTLNIQPKLTPQDDITIKYAYYFEDLANYIDKILYTQKHKPEEMQEMRGFVTRPAGQRY